MGKGTWEFSFPLSSFSPTSFFSTRVTCPECHRLLSLQRGGEDPLLDRDPAFWDFLGQLSRALPISSFQNFVDIFPFCLVILDLWGEDTPKASEQNIFAVVVVGIQKRKWDTWFFICHLEFMFFSFFKGNWGCISSNSLLVLLQDSLGPPLSEVLEHGWLVSSFIHNCFVVLCWLWLPTQTISSLEARMWSFVFL